MKKKKSMLAPFLILGEILCVYFGYVANGVWEKGVDVMTFMERFDNALLPPSLKYMNKTTPKAVLVATILYGIAVLMYLTSRRNLMHGKEFGTAKFADAAMLNKKLADEDESKNRILSNNVRVSLDTTKTHINNNVLIIGGSGAGKTFYMVKPNIMQMMEGGSFIALDPKGEIARATGKMLRDNGYNVKILNLIDMKQSDCYNPFRYIKEENDVIKLVTNLISNTTPKDAAPTDPFWTKSEGMLLQALFYYVWKELPEEEQNFQSVLSLLSQAEVNEKNRDSELTKKIKKLAETSPLGVMHPAYKQYMKVIRGAGDTVRSIIISANSRLALLENEQILRVLSKDDLKLEELGIGVGGDKKTRTALFCIIPDSDKSYNFVVGMLYTQLFQELYRQADFKYGGKLPLEVTLMMDEFANVALPDDFCSILSTMRSRRINAMIIIQNMAQLKALFKDTWETITGNCDSLVYLGGNEKSTHQYISEMLGKATIDKRSNGETRGVHGSSSRNYDVLGRELMMPDEVRNMDNSKCLVFIKGFQPVFDDKYIPMRHKNFHLTEDGGAAAYEHNKKEKIGTIKFLSEKGLDQIEHQAKENKAISFYDMSLEEIMMLEEVTEGNESNQSEADGDARVLSKPASQGKTDEEIDDEITEKLCSENFSDEQIQTIYALRDIGVSNSFILDNLDPSIPAKELSEKGKEYIKQRRE